MGDRHPVKQGASSRFATEVGGTPNPLGTSIYPRPKTLQKLLKGKMVRAFAIYFDLRLDPKFETLLIYAYIYMFTLNLYEENPFICTCDY